MINRNILYIEDADFVHPPKWDEPRNIKHINWMEGLTDDAMKAATEASIVVINGRIVKNRHGNISPAQAEEDREKRRAFVTLMAGALSGPMLDLEDGKGPQHPIDQTNLLTTMLLDDVDEMWAAMKAKGWL